MKGLFITMILVLIEALPTVSLAQSDNLNVKTTTSGGGSTTTTQGTKEVGGVTFYGQQKTFSSSSTPDSNPHNSQSSTGAGIVIPIPERKK
ncbi:hypothetical protein [Pseudolabrys sp. Root1462]|uniref:hypothetical protein n=1 Tax=Pseudolabrys sp. Root1462 TaxID=1736466 RepID=UPI0012E3442C|nr:hypothetical protein [Pseudolabrys sp. Root1462]